ncbi:MAG TPA: efflux RND transporter periplasmic adaptor subunit [Kofleriaceae bacterium]|nr:efflux RND transporter periplasmic adaptor subunit [Kofleriaceae bacterium]
MRRFLGPAIATVVVGVLAIVFRTQLVAWFSGRPMSSGKRSAAASVTTGALAIATSVTPDPPQVSGNRFRVEVKDAKGAPVDDAKVSVTWDMPAMGAMQEMKGTVPASAEASGVYASDVDLPGGGSYLIEVEVESSAGNATAKYDLTVGSPGLAAAGGGGGAPMDLNMPMPAPPAPAPAPAPYAFSPAALGALEQTFGAYEAIRAALAHDRLADIAAPARTIAAALGAMHGALASAPAAIADSVHGAAIAADALATAKDLDRARSQFGELSRALQSLAVADPRLASGWHVFECPMAPGWQGWFQKSPSIENPYMGTKSPTCGGASRWEGPSTAKPAPAIDERTVITVDERRRAYLGIRTGTAVRAPMTLAIRAVGRLTFDETKLTDVVVRVSGYITKLRVNATGQSVKKGDTLFTFYSPDLFAAQQEVLFAKKRAGDDADDPLLRASEKKLALWGFDRAQLAALYARGEPLEDVPFASPASGVVTEKDVVEGDAIQMGMKLFRIAPIDQIWVEADVYEGDLARIAKGQHAAITLTYLPGRTFDGTVAFVYPYLDPASRTGRVRVQLPNKGLELKPDMYATVAFRIELGERVQVPKSAVVYTGPRRIVFVDLGGGRIAPRDVTIGASTDDMIEIVDGLAEGERVITSGNFLVASESRIRSAAFWEAKP